MSARRCTSLLSSLVTERRLTGSALPASVRNSSYAATISSRGAQADLGDRTQARAIRELEPVLAGRAVEQFTRVPDAIGEPRRRGSGISSDFLESVAEQAMPRPPSGCMASAQRAVMTFAQ